MVKKGIIVIVVIALIAVLTAFAFNFFKQSPPDIAEQELAHRDYLEEFLADTGLIFVPVVRKDFAYYKLHTADKQLAGFVFLGEKDGWAGPIRLFVKTDKSGVIEQVTVWHHTETPIFVIGMPMFLEAFAKHHIASELRWQEDIHGLTGATVTAEAIIAAVHEPGLIAYQKGILTIQEPEARIQEPE